MFWNSSTRRKVVGTWTDLVSTILIPDPVTGESVQTQHMAATGHPALPLPLVVVGDTQSNGDEYPKNGTIAAGGQTPTLPAAVTADPTGLLILGTNDTPSGWKGQVRRIVSVTGSAGAWVATPNRDFDTAPNTSSTCQLLIPVFRAQELLVKGEFENGGALSATLLAMFYALPLTPALVATASPIQVPDQELALDSLDRQGGTVNASYRHAKPRTIKAFGMIGAKLILVTKPSSGKLALFGCGI